MSTTATKAAVVRNVADKLGTLRRVRAGADGLYADLCCLVSHPLWPRLAEAAETQPHLFGLSHVAEGETSRRTAEPSSQKSPRSTRSMWSRTRRQSMGFSRPSMTPQSMTWSRHIWPAALTRQTSN